MTVSLTDSHNRKQICRWQVCAGSWWNTVAVSDGILFGMYRTPTAWTMTAALYRCGIVHRLSQQPHPPRRAHDFRRKYHLPSGVVSKCALREAYARSQPSLFVSFVPSRFSRIAFSASKSMCCAWGNTLSKIAPSWISRRVLMLRSFFRFRASASSMRCFA